MRVGPAFLYLAGVFLYCVMNVILKQELLTYSVIMANAWRYLFAGLFTVMLWLGSGRPGIKSEMLPLHFVRGIVIAISAASFFFAVTRLTLAETITISFVSPLLVPPIAALFLKEHLEPRSIGVGALGFVGVLIASGASTATIAPARLEGVASALLSALTYALATVLLRARAEHDDAAVVSMLGAVIPALVLLVTTFATAQGGRIGPALEDLPRFAAAGLCGAVALWLFARALARQEAQRLVPFEYSSLPWLALFGFVFFGEQITLRTLVGAGLIITACSLQAGRLRLPVRRSAS